MRRGLVLCITLAGGIAIILSSLNPQPEAENIMGNYAYEQAGWSAALKHYQLAQVLAPDTPEYYYNAASVLAQTGRLRDAISALEQALLHSDAALTLQAQYNLANIYFELARYDEAIRLYRAVLTANPIDEDARYNYELALARLEQTPPPQEQMTEPEQDDTEPDVTPTSNPAEQTGPTPTPEPEQDDNQPESGGTPQNAPLDLPASLPGGTLTIEEVERQLDAIQNAQQTMREVLSHQATPAAQTGKDW